MLYYKDIIEFIVNVAAKARPMVGIPAPWPLNERHWEELPHAKQTAIRTELDEMLCKLGRHDYEYVTELEDGRYELKCFYCLHKKITDGGR